MLSAPYFLATRVLSSSRAHWLCIAHENTSSSRMLAMPYARCSHLAVAPRAERYTNGTTETAVDKHRYNPVSPCRMGEPHGAVISGGDRLP